MAQAIGQQQMRFVDAAELRGWATSLEDVGVMSVTDQMLGGLDGLLVDETDRPYYLVVRSKEDAERRFLLPIGITWFDDTTGVIRTDANAASAAQCPPFDEQLYRKMSPDEGWQYERRVLRACCPETLAQPGERLDYYKALPHFRPPAWLKR